MNKSQNPPENSLENDTSKKDIIDSNSYETSNSNNLKPKKPLTQFEISQLSFKNEKLNEEARPVK